MQKIQGWTNYIKPTITIHMFIICMRMVGDDIQMSFEVESLVCGYHCYSTMWEKNFPASWNWIIQRTDLLWQCQREITRSCAKKNIIDLLIISVEKRDDYYLLSYRLKRTFSWPFAGVWRFPFWREQQRYLITLKIFFSMQWKHATLMQQLTKWEWL